MPANVSDPTAHQVIRWTGMSFRKFNANPIRVLPMREKFTNAPRVILGLVGLLSEDHLALAMWEAL